MNRSTISCFYIYLKKKLVDEVIYTKKRRHTKADSRRVVEQKAGPRQVIVTKNTKNNDKQIGIIGIVGIIGIIIGSIIIISIICS